MVLKANAYGHGIEDMVPLAEDFGVDHFSVFSTAEAMRAHKVKSPTTDLMIMGWIDDDYIEWAIMNDVSFFVFSRERLMAACKKAGELKKNARVHIELETGMHRTGFAKELLPQLVEDLKKHVTNVELEGLCTHFAGAEHMENFDRIRRQIRNFREMCNWLHEHGFEPRYHHAACSSGIVNFPETALDLVRIGIMSYGFWPSSESRMNYLLNHKLDEDPLKRILSWKSEVMSVNHVDEGEYISYGKSYLTNRRSKIATVPVGYGYGFSRNLSNNGHVLVGGKRVPVIGIVNMNEMVIDVTDVEDVSIGDEVTLIGSQQDRTITVSSFGDMNNSLNYELLSRLPTFIPRKVVEQ